MADRQKIVVKRLKLTPDQLQIARDRASENIKTLIVWKDTKTSKSSTQDGEKSPT